MLSLKQCKLNLFRIISPKIGGNSKKLAVPVAPVALAFRMYAEIIIDREIEKCLPAVHPTNRFVQTKLLALLLQMIKYDTRSVFE